MPITMQVLLALLWFLAGCVIAIPYTYLVNGSFDSFFMTAWIAPAVALFLFFAYIMRGDGKRPKWGGSTFWMLVAYFCIPILLNGASLLLKWAGYEAVGHFVFRIRYLGLFIAPIYMVIYNLGAGIVEMIKRLIKHFSKTAIEQGGSK